MQNSPKRGFENTLESLRQLLCALGQYLQPFVILALLPKSFFSAVPLQSLPRHVERTTRYAEYDLLTSACPPLPLLTCHSRGVPCQQGNCTVHRQLQGCRGMFSSIGPRARCWLPEVFWEDGWMEELAGDKDLGLLEFRLQW